METFKSPNISVNPPQRLSEVWGLLATTTTKPTYTPKTLSEQMIIWNNSGTRKLCIYDTASNTWMGVTISSI